MRAAPQPSSAGSTTRPPLRFGYVGAPAGSGKMTVSTLLWLKACKRKVVWIGLDRYDNAPTVFFKLLATGLLSVQPEERGHAPRPREAVVSRVARRYHVIMMLAEMQAANRGATRSCWTTCAPRHEPLEIMKALPAVLKRLPRAFAVFLLSRNESCPMSCAASCASRPSSSGPTSCLHRGRDPALFQKPGRALTAKETRFAFAATEGWAIGVAAVAKTGKIDSGSSHYLFASYFESQVWNAWDPDLPEFCLRIVGGGRVRPGARSAADGASRRPRRSWTSSTVRTRSSAACMATRTVTITCSRISCARRPLPTESTARSCARRPPRTTASTATTPARCGSGWKAATTAASMPHLLLFLFENNRGQTSPKYADFLNVLRGRGSPSARSRNPAAASWGVARLPDQPTRAVSSATWTRCTRNLPRIARADSRFMEYALLAYSVDHRTSILEKVKHFRAFGRFIKRFTPEGWPRTSRRSRTTSPTCTEQPGLLRSGAGGQVPCGSWKATSRCCWARSGATSSRASRRASPTSANRLDEALEGHRERAAAKVIPENKVEGRLCVAVMYQQTLWQLGRTDEADAVLDELDRPGGARGAVLPAEPSRRIGRLSLLDADKRVARTWLDEFFVTEVERLELYRVPQHFHDGAGSSGAGTSGGVPARARLAGSVRRNSTARSDVARGGRALKGGASSGRAGRRPKPARRCRRRSRRLRAVRVRCASWPTRARRSNWCSSGCSSGHVGAGIRRSAEAFPTCTSCCWPSMPPLSATPA